MRSDLRTRSALTQTLGFILSLAFALLVCIACIMVQPRDQTVVEGEQATFTVTTSGAGATTYQWQRSDDGGAVWTAIPGATSASYVTPPTTLADDGALFQVIVTDDDGVATSNAATLTVNMAPPQIVSEPSDLTVLENEPATFSLSATGSGTVTYQWDRSDDAGATWASIAGATNDTYVLASAALGDSGARFRCTVTNEAGSVQSQAATLTVNVNYGGWWELYFDYGTSLDPGMQLEFHHTDSTVEYLDIAMAVTGTNLVGFSGSGLGFDVVALDHDTLEGDLVIGGNPIAVVLLRGTPTGTHAATGDFVLSSTTSSGVVEALGPDVYFVSIDHMGADQTVMLEIEAISAPITPGTLTVGTDVDIGLHVEEMVGGLYTYTGYIAVGGSVTFTAVNTTTVTGTYVIAMASGESITGSFDVPVFVLW